jgi:cyclopropane fatty-acyl-phospholipid synthase-like methyltransferase
MLKIAVLLALAVLPCAAQRPFSRNVSEHSKSLAPFVSSPQVIVDRMLEVAQLKPSETVYDLGSGDGRVLITAAQRYNARGVGIEISEQLVKATNEKIRQLELGNRITVLHGDMLTADLSSADVVVMYLESKSNEMLRPNLEKYLRPGSRVVSHDFAVRGWKANHVERVEAYKRPHTIYLYVMPPQQ